MNFGCIPIVSNVSSIGQYVSKENGFILDSVTSQNFNSILNKTVTIQEAILQEKARKGYLVAQNFTFERYRIRIYSDILGGMTH